MMLLQDPQEHGQIGLCWLALLVRGSYWSGSHGKIDWLVMFMTVKLNLRSWTVMQF